jgi:digeranylgeranylglycerophospholipid reductase
MLLESDLGNLHHAANTLFEGMAARSRTKIEDCYLQKELEGMRILGPGGAAVTIPAKGYFIDRQRFDDHYLRLAESAGVVLLSGTARRSKLNGNRRTVTFGEDEVDARVVVDATGVESALARQAGLEPMLHPEDVAWALEADVEHPGLGEELFFQYWVGSMAPGWKATFSPAGGDRATLGVFVRGHGPNVQSFFLEFLKRFKAYKAAQYRDIEDIKIRSIKRGGDPIAVLPGELAADSLLVTGGAAGQSGLVYGMRAGAICGMVAAKAVSASDVSRKALSRYKQLWNAEFYWEYRMGRASLQTLAGMKDNEIERLLQGLSETSLISRGSFLKKAAYLGAKVAVVGPRAMVDMIWNLAKG